MGETEGDTKRTAASVATPPVRIAVAIPTNLRDPLKRYAEEMGLSQASVIRICIATFFGLNQFLS